MHLEETLSEEQKKNYAWEWFNNHLAKGETPWIRFRPKEIYCANEGFIPYQYRAMLPVEEATNTWNRVIQRQVLKHGYRGIHYAMGWLELFELIASFGIISTESLPGRPPTLLDYKGPPLNFSSNVSNNACNNKQTAGVRRTKTNQNKGKGRLKSAMLQGSTRAVFGLKASGEPCTKCVKKGDFCAQHWRQRTNSISSQQFPSSFPGFAGSAPGPSKGRFESAMLQGSTRAKKKQRTNKPTLPTSTALEPKKETSMSTATLQGLLSNPTPHSPAAETEPNEQVATSYPTPPGLLIEEEVYPPEPKSDLVFSTPDPKSNLGNPEPNPDPNEIYQVQRMNEAVEWGFRYGSTAFSPPWMEN
jgi:hypothetical protein